MKYLFIFSILIISYQAYSQSNKDIEQAIDKLKNSDIPKPHLNPYKSADSIKNQLIKLGIDTVLLFYKTDNNILSEIQNEDGTDEHRKAFIIWKSKNDIFIQRINSYAIYNPLRTSRSEIDLHFLFKYYVDHRSSIKSEEINSKGYYRFARIAGDDIFKMVMTDNPLIIIDINIGNDDFSANFNGIRRYYYNDVQSFHADLDKKLYIWTMLIENELRAELKGRKWIPYKMDYMSDEEKNQIINRIRKGESGN